jgi:hypothetical protein
MNIATANDEGDDANDEQNDESCNEREANEPIQESKACKDLNYAKDKVGQFGSNVHHIISIDLTIADDIALGELLVA